MAHYPYGPPLTTVFGRHSSPALVGFMSSLLPPAGFTRVRLVEMCSV
jgi:hypothetical protein